VPSGKLGGIGYVSVKVILLISFGLSAFVAQAQTLPEPVEPEVGAEVRAPMIMVHSASKLVPPHAA